MLKLEAILVAMTRARPWRDGWSPNRGIDFIAWAPTPPTIVAGPVDPAWTVAAEPVCFLDADDNLSPGTEIVRHYVSLAAEAAKAATRGPIDIPLTRAWSSMARKAPGS